ncbi:MAG: hypothetical protein ACHQ9S_03590 [Candidatus Binatia bacterium]
MPREIHRSFAASIAVKRQFLRAGGTTDTACIQETHILAGHVICDQVDARLFGGGSRKR